MCALIVVFLLQVKASIIKQYVASAPIIYLLLAVLGVVLNTSGIVLNNIWLGKWSADNLLNATEAAAKADIRVAVYGGLGAAQGTFNHSQNPILSNQVYLKYAHS